MNLPHQILQKYWGYKNFRPLQEGIINAILEGKDCLALLPTGGGKSICFQVSALAKDGICLVVSPLIALIKDQVENLKQKDIPALAIYTGMHFLEVKKTLQNAAYGNFKFLYVSPERLETNLFLEYLPLMNINLIAVDEAHCISQWGYDFRPSYLRIANLREWLPNIAVLALTASATKIVKEDICVKLLFKKNQKQFQQSFERGNLSYSVFNVALKQNKLLEILKNVDGSAIVYCKSRKHTKEVADLLRMNTINADYYHAGLHSEERSNKQQSWIINKTRVMVCTNAFGMGIDKPDVRVVVHYDMPDCVENYYQEAGRAGRDGKKAYAVLLYSTKEINDLIKQTNIRFPIEGDIKIIYTALMNHLQIAAGIGEGVNADFDIAQFCTLFKLPILPVTYAIKALEQEGVISFNEMVFKPSTIIFTTNKKDLEEFEKIRPQLEPLIKGLLRLYEGIFDFPATINEAQLAQFIKCDIDLVKKNLSQLHHYNIILYSPQKDKPQITLLQNRMYADNYAINMTNYLLRKNNFDKRVKAIENYILDTTICRAKIIANYFDAPINKDCGICDNCINIKENEISVKEFENISSTILLLIKEKPFLIKELYAKMYQTKKEKILNVVHFLQSENKIVVNAKGEILST